jgi:Ca2+-binding EF-hand superfamily protein
VDKNGDGKITRDEIAVYVGAAPKGKPEAKKPDAEESKSEAAPPKPPRTLKEHVADFFRRYDANKDKRIQREEFQAGEDVFKDWDRNRNGELSTREVTRYLRARLEELKKRPTVANFFELFDLNRDRKVTRREYDGPAEFFRRYDHDKDRVITESELNMGPDARGMSEADREFMKDGPTEAPEKGMLERYDEDGDGRITLEELNGAESVLRRLDRNGDGVLSGREVR